MFASDFSLIKKKTFPFLLTFSFYISFYILYTVLHPFFSFVLSHLGVSILDLFFISVPREPKSALSLATRLYEEAMLVPYMVRISMFYRENYPRAWVNTIRIYCMTDDKAEKVIRASSLWSL